jgi:hypothetical protein
MLNINAPAHRQSILVIPTPTKAPVDAHSSTFYLRPKKLSERHGSTASAEGLQDGHPGRSVGAEINYTKCQHTGPSSEAKISRSPALPCPTATCSRQSAPTSQNFRREDGPVGLPPEALELMSYGPLLGRCSKTPRFCAKPDSAQASARRPKKGLVLMVGGHFWQEAVYGLFSRP